MNGVTSENKNAGFTNVTIKEGSWDKTDDIITHFTWESKKNKDKSSVFTYDMDVAAMYLGFYPTGTGFY